MALSNISGNLVNEIEMAVDTLVKAMINVDEAVLNQLCAEQLTYGHSGGKLQTKAQFIESITSGASNFLSIDVSQQQIIIQDNTAIVRHILSAKTNDKGKQPGTVNISILLVWVNNNNYGWQLLARQAVKV